MMIHSYASTPRTAPDYGPEIIPSPAAAAPLEPNKEGYKTWLPSLAVLVALPLLALATTTYVLLPSLRQAFLIPEPSPEQSSANWGSPTVYLAKIPYHNSGIRSLALVGASSSFKTKVAQNKNKLTALAAIDLDRVKRDDLYHPGVLEAKRDKLRSDFNRTLGGSLVKEVYIAVWPEK